MDSVFAAPQEKRGHAAVHFAAEDADEGTVFVDESAIESAFDNLIDIPADHRVVGVSPNREKTLFWLILPRDGIAESGIKDFAHGRALLNMS